MGQRHVSRSLRLAGIPLLVISIFFFIQAAAWGAEWPKDVRVISPAPGATVHMIAVGVGKAVQKHTPIENWIVQPLGGPKLWLPMMKDGKCDFAMHSAPDILNAFLGRGLYSALGPMPVRQIIAGHEYMFMFWTTPDKGINSLSDLKGKVAYIHQKANPMFTEMANNQLAAAGMSVKDLKAGLAFASIKEASADLIEGRVDAVLYPVVPGAVMQINEAKGECKFVNLSASEAKYVTDHMEGYYAADVPANDPRFRNKSAVPNAINYQSAMFTSVNMNPDVVYGVTKAILDNTDEFADTHPSARYWSAKHRPISLAVPYHEGAVRYYKEKGMWTAEAQAYQEKLIERQAELLKKK